ncbi:hypothetical protein STEG23_028413 [Scotinomys teguina]
MPFNRRMDKENVVHIHNGVLCSRENNDIMKFAGKWMELENVILSKICLSYCYDQIAKTLSVGCSSSPPHDPTPQYMVNMHPGHFFLKEVSEFHSQYITTAELDINCIIFEHFYVIYCKFCELNNNHDLAMDGRDLGRHADRTISSRMTHRIFLGAVTGVRVVASPFPTASVLLDLDRNGTFSGFELKHFYEEQTRLLEAPGTDPLPFCDYVYQVFDVVWLHIPGEGGRHMCEPGHTAAVKMSVSWRTVKLVELTFGPDS